MEGGRIPRPWGTCRGLKEQRQRWVHSALEGDVTHPVTNRGWGGARELAFISTASRTKRNELKLRREGLKLDIQGKNFPDAKAGEVTEQVMGRAAEARPWRGLRVNIHPSGVVSDTEGPGVLEWRLSDSSSSPEILWLHLKGQTVPR